MASQLQQQRTKWMNWNGREQTSEQASRDLATLSISTSAYAWYEYVSMSNDNWITAMELEISPSKLRACYRKTEGNVEWERLCTASLCLTLFEICFFKKSGMRISLCRWVKSANSAYRETDREREWERKREMGRDTSHTLEFQFMHPMELMVGIIVTAFESGMNTFWRHY